MLIYHREVDLEKGFEVLEKSKHDRLIGGKRVDPPSGRKLFTALFNEGKALKCWHCGVEATCFVANKGKKDLVGAATLDLFAVKGGHYLLMTRDHIIPKSLGGCDENENLRIGCSPCNSQRGNAMTPDDVAFMKANPQLITREVKAVLVIVDDYEVQAPPAPKKKKRRRRKAIKLPSVTSS